VRLTPLDIQNHRFPQRMRGYDPAEVESFLKMVGEDYESLVRETETLREQVRTLEARVAGLSANEKTLQDTLVMAQSLAGELKQTAERESEVMVSEAEVRAEKVLDAAHRRVAKLAEDIREMKLLRIRVAAAVRTTIETHLALLEGFTQDPEDDPVLDGKVAFLTGRRAAGSDGGA
jgi:cell division initiation protein